MKTKLFTTILSIILLLSFWSGPAAASEPIATWTAPEGIEYISFSRAWAEDKLPALHAELKNNGHGTELNYLQSVTIYPQSDNFANGSYEQMDQSWVLGIRAPGFLPTNWRYRTKMGAITLYNGDNRTSPSEMARTLAHEYGHHFTYFHFYDRQNWRSSEYYRLRNLSQYPLVDDYASIGINEYKEYWLWDVGEIAAEDYVQLLGSAKARQLVTNIRDIQGMLKYSLANPQIPDNQIWLDNIHPQRGGNTYPHGNIYLPLPLETPGLTEYFYSFIDKDPPLKFRTSSTPQLSYRKVSPKQYIVSWQAVSADPDILYTLMCFDEQRNTWAAVKTVHGDQIPQAVIGTAQQDRYTWSDNLTRGTKQFRLYVTFPDGYMVSSPILSINFSGPEYQREPLNKEVSDYSLAVSADQTEGQSDSTIQVKLDWQWQVLSQSQLSHGRALAVTNSLESPHVWDWQHPGEENTSEVTLDTPGVWYIHYHMTNEQETVNGVYGPYNIEAQTIE